MTKKSVLAMLLLADGRYPAGGHAHSAGIEAAVTSRAVHDLASLEAFLEGKLHTVGLVDAALAAATARHLGANADAAVVQMLDDEANVRIVVAALRRSSRKLGRQLIRVAAQCWPDPVLRLATAVAPGGLHAAIAFGAVGVASGLDAPEVAALSIHHAMATPAQAAVRLLGLDPFAVAAVTARLAPLATELVDAALEAARGPLVELPAVGAVLSDIAAEAHSVAPTRLFAT